MDILWTKVLALSIVGLGSLFSGLAAIPVRLEAHIELLTRLIEIVLFSDRLVRSGKSISRRQILISSLLSCLGGGVLLATTMIHILPEVTENLKEQAEKIELESLPQLVVCAGGKYITALQHHRSIRWFINKTKIEKYCHRILLYLPGGRAGGVLFGISWGGRTRLL